VLFGKIALYSEESERRFYINFLKKRSKSRQITNAKYLPGYYPIESIIRVTSKSTEYSFMYFRIDAPLYGVDEIRPETLHLPKSDPRYDILAYHHGGDEFLAVLLSRHAQ